MMMKRADLNQRLQAAHRKVGEWRDQIPNVGECRDSRIMFYLEILNRFDLLRKDVRLLDLGGGFSWFAPLAIELGVETIMVDDFAGGGGLEELESAVRAQAILERMRARGIQIHAMDILKDPLPIETESIDIATCFHSMEHWHSSPKPVLQELRRVIRPGGYLLLAGPNALNLRKRITVALGKSNLAPFSHWYDPPVFRGHVREPVVSEFRQMLEWNEFSVRGIWGRNFMAYEGAGLTALPRWLRHLLVGSTEPFVQLFPSLCSDIHAIGQKREAGK
jgi:SAM-dependent methyltransferase